MFYTVKKRKTIVPEVAKYRIMKEELVQRMQHPFSTDGVPPPWLGMYGFGEYARLAGSNTFHNYTTALAAIYRK